MPTQFVLLDFENVQPEDLALLKNGDLKVIIDDLVKRKSARPKTLKTLRSTIKARLRNRCSEQVLDELIEHLTRIRALRIVDGKPQYELPS